MEERTKQRLVGALVLVGALFIILPFLFHNARPSAIPDDDADFSAQTEQPIILPDNTKNTVDSNTVISQAQNVSDNTQPSAQPTVANSPAAPTVPASPVAASTPAPAPTPVAPMQTQPIQAQQVPAQSQQISDTTATAALNPTGFTPGETNLQPTPMQTAAAQTSVNTTSANQVAEKTENNDEVFAESEIEATPQVATPRVAKIPAVKPNVAQHKRSPAVSHQFRYVEVQVGVFAEQKNVTRLLSQLHKKHYTAYARNMTRNGRALTGVYIAESNVTQAKLAQQALRRDFALNSQIVKHSLNT